MQIGRPPSVDGTRGPAEPAGAQNATARQGSVAAPAADRADIRPLSVPAVLQILIAEILDAWAQPPAPVRPDTPLQAALLVVQRFLDALPAGDAAPKHFIAVHDALVVAMERGIDRTQAVVAAWRDVPAETTGALHEARTMVSAALGEDAPAPMPGPWFMRPEWLDLAPRIDLMRRRRRRARRRLLDPDLDLDLPDTGREPAG